MYTRVIHPTMIAVFFVLASLAADAAPAKVSCKPKGTEFERLGCIHNENVALSVRLNKHYRAHLDTIFNKCEADNPGRGSGGFSDRISCVTQTLKGESERVKFKK